MALKDLIDEEFPTAKPEAAAAAPEAQGGGGLKSLIEDEFSGAPPKPEPPGLLARAADAVTSAVTAIPKAIATGFKSVGPAVAPDAAKPPTDVAIPQAPGAAELKATGRSASVIPEPPPQPVAQVKIAPVPGPVDILKAKPPLSVAGSMGGGARGAQMGQEAGAADRAAEAARQAALVQGPRNEVIAARPEGQGDEERGVIGRTLDAGLEKVGLLDREQVEERRRQQRAAKAVLSIVAGEAGKTSNQFRQPSPRILEQAAQGAATSMTLGIGKQILKTYGFEEDTPETTAEGLAHGAGELGGFMLGPAKLAHQALEGRVLSHLAPAGGNTADILVAKSVASQAATLGLASVLAHVGDLADAPTLLDALKEAAGHAKGGAILGAAFGGLGGTIHNRAARLGVGLATLDLLQGTHPMDEREWAQKAFDYGLNIFFLWKGQDPQRVMAALEAKAAENPKGPTPEAIFKSALDKAMERSAKLKDAPATPGAPAPDRSAELSAILEEELTAATTPLKSAAEVAVEKTGGPLERPVPEAAAPEIVLAGGPRPAARPAAPRPTPNVVIPGRGADIPSGPVRLLDMTGKPLEIPAEVVDGLETAQDKAAARAQGLSRPKAGKPQPAAGRPAPVEFQGFQERVRGQAPMELWGLTEDIPGTQYVKGSTVGRQTLEGLGYTVPPAPGAAAPAAATGKLADRPVTGLTFKDFAEVSGKKWPLTSKDPDFARLRFEFDDMKKGLYEARPTGTGPWAVINRKTGEEVDHLPSGAKAQLEANRLNGVVTLDAWRNAQVPAPLRMILPERPKADLAAKPAPEVKPEPGTAAARQHEAEAATLEGKPASAEPPAPAKEAAPPAEVAAAGKEQEIRVPAGSKYRIRFELAEAEDLVPSHDPKSFAKDTRYPEGVQNRPYHSDKSEQVKVIRQAQDFEPQFLLAQRPTTEGSPILAPDSNVVLSGNSRSMTVMRTVGTPAFENYRAQLREQAGQFGLTPEQVDAMKSPVLVRRLVGTDQTPEFYRRFAKEANESFTQALNTQASAVSQGAAVKPETMEWIAAQLDTLGETASLREFLRTGRDREIIRRFIQDGVFTERDLNRFIDPKTTMLNEDGKRMIERAILGNAIPDPDLIGQIPPAVAAKIERALGAFAKIKGRGEAWDLGKDMEAALRTVIETQATGAGSVDALRRQGSLLEAAAPTTRADTLADAMLRMKPNDFKAAIGRYADEAQRDVRGQETLGFAKPSSPEDAFRQAFSPERPPSRRVAEEPAPYTGTSTNRMLDTVKDSGIRRMLEEAKPGEVGWLPENLEAERKTAFDTPEIIQLRRDTARVEDTIKGKKSPDPSRERIDEIWVPELDKIEAMPARQERRIWIVMGPPAAGKSGVIVEPLAKEHAAKIIDSDTIKQGIPEGGGGRYNDKVHEESDRIAGIARREAMRQGDNIILPIVGKGYDSVLQYLEEANRAGYEVNLRLMDLPAEAAAFRTTNRILEGLRGERGAVQVVDPAYALSIGQRPRENYVRLVNEGRATNDEAFSNDVPRGAKPRKLTDAELGIERQAVARPERSGEAGQDRGGRAGAASGVPEVRLRGVGSEAGAGLGSAVPAGPDRRLERVRRTEAGSGAEGGASRPVVDQEAPPPDFDLPPVSASEAGGRGLFEAAKGLTMRMLGGVREPEASYDPARPPFFSALAKAIDAKMPERATAEQILAITKSPGVKADEVKWTGLEEWLAEQKGPVTKAQVQAFLRDNAVKVEEKLLGADGPRARLENLQVRDPESLTAAERSELDRLVAEDQGPVASTKFSKYQVPGGNNYRELLLTLPARPDQPTFDPEKVQIKRDLRSQTQGSTAIWYEGKELARYGDDPKLQPGLNDRGEVVYKQRPDDYWMGVAKDLFEKGDSRNSIKSLSGAYRSGHWDEPNVLAHVRFNDRIDKDGKRVLFLEELQSDWHQAGRRKGYVEPYRGDDYTVAQEDGGRGRWWIYNREGVRQQGSFATEAEGRQAVAQHQADLQKSGGKVPDAPFKKTWHELAFKRMLRWAAEHGYDRVAWTTGEQQAERYDLSKHVSHIKWDKLPDGDYGIRATGLRGAEIEGLRNKRVSPDELADVIGKELADKILASDKDTGVFEGLDLKVGGEGMKGFYDKILPEFAAKYGKKWGATVGETRVEGRPADTELEIMKGGRGTWGVLDPEDPAGPPLKEFPTRREAQEYVRSLGNTETVHSIDVTPEMRRSVLIEGQNLFSPESPYAGSRVRARKGATTADREMAQLTLFDLEQAAQRPVESVQVAAASTGRERPATPNKEDAGAGVRTVVKMIEEIKDKGFLDFRGQTVREGAEGLKDLALLGQVARDPRYETFRYFYTKGGEIVGSEAFSARVPGATNILEIFERIPKAEAGVGPELAARSKARTKHFSDMTRRMERLGADGYYLMHNHPSGRSEPSRADLDVTEMVAARVPGFKGHVVINSGEFSHITLADSGRAIATTERLTLSPMPSPILKGGGRHELFKPEDVAKFAATLKTPDNYVTLIHRDSSGAVRGVQEMPRGLFVREKEASDYIRGQQRAFGASSTFAVLKPDWRSLERARAFVRDGTLMDAIHAGSAESTLTDLQSKGVVSLYRLPEKAADMRSVRVQEEGAPYGDFERLKPETRKKLVDYGRDVLKDNKTDFASWSKAMREKLGEKSTGTLPGAWAALMQEQARTQKKPDIRPDMPKAKAPEAKGKGADKPADIPQSAAPLEPPPGMTEPQLKLAMHKDVVDAAMDLFKAGKIERDRSMLISDQILESLRDGKLRIEDMADILDKRGMTFAEFGAQMFRPAITDAAKRLGALGQLQRRLNELESDLKRDAAAPGKPGEPDPVKVKTIGDILDAARVLDPKGDKLRNRTMMAALTYWRRADNVRRGLLVTQLATSVRNFTSQVGRLGIDVMDQGLQGGLQRAFGKDVTQHPADGMRAMMEVFSRRPAAAKARVDALLEGLPREEERLFSNYASDLNMVAKRQGADKVIDSGLRGAERAVEVLNTFNRFQEYAVRRAVFQTELAARLRRRGIDLEEAIKDQKVRREIPVADIRAAIEKALEVTFASNPAYGSAGYHFVKWINQTPGATFLIPFPRFMVNALKFYLEFSPAGFLKFLSEGERQKFRQGDMKTMSRGLLGVGLLSAAYLIRSMQDDDTKWNEVRLPGMERTIDVRPLNPFASYLFVADVLRRMVNGNLYGGGLATEAVKNILGVNVRGGTGLQAVDQLVDGLRDIGDARALTKYLQGAGGHLVAGLLTPLQQLTDVYAEFDPESQILRNTREQPFSGPIKQRFPSTVVEALGGEVASEKASPTSGEPLLRESPGVRQVTGLTLGKAKNDFEKELDRLQIPYREILPSQHDPRLDNILARHMGPIAEEVGGRIVNSSRYQGLGEIGKRLELKSYLTRLRKQAKAKALMDPEYREVTREVKAGVSKERLKDMAQEERAGLR